MLNGCVNSATKIPYTHSAPPEETCTLNIIATLTVRNFDGKEVDWKPNWGDSWASVQISAGSHTFIVDYERQINRGFAPGTPTMQMGRHHRGGITISYDKFMAGHTYQMIAAEGMEAVGFTGMFANMAQTMRNAMNNSLRIVIRDVTEGYSVKDDILYGLEPPQ
jgi:hypothetical protein